jgi:hypothetical protein
MSQFKRIYADDGRNDVSFAAQEDRLRIANRNLTEATQALARASELLNDAATNIAAPDKLH